MGDVNGSIVVRGATESAQRATMRGDAWTLDGGHALDQERDEGGATAGPQSNRRALRAVVRGRVQGVGFRDFVRRRARALGCGGWVRNLPDGRSVEVQAEGEQAALEALLAIVRRGPPGSYVNGVTAEWSTATGTLTDFAVLR